MFDIGFQELLLISVLALLIMGPERLPGAIRTASLWLAKFRRSFQQIKNDIEQEIGADEIRRELHNDAVLKNIERSKQQLEKGLSDIKHDLNELEYDISDVDNNTENNTNKPSKDQASWATITFTQTPVLTSSP